jgi:hypothetical protein
LHFLFSRRSEYSRVYEQYGQTGRIIFGGKVTYSTAVSAFVLNLAKNQRSAGGKLTYYPKQINKIGS